MSAIALRLSTQGGSPRIDAADFTGGGKTAIDLGALSLDGAGGADAIARGGGDQPLDAFPKSSILRSIDWGSTVDASAIKVYFAKQGEVFDGEMSIGWNAYEKQQAMQAFEQFEHISNVSFTQVDNPDDATFKLVVIQNAGYLGYFNPPGETNEGVGVFVRGGTGWDENNQGGLDQGGYGFITMIHEFGHGMGLAHPHDGGGSSTVMQGVSGPFDDYGAFDLNQGVFTTMSYNDGWATGPNGNPNVNLGYGWQGTMMALDIAVLQDKYGANMEYKTGNDIYTLKGANGTGAMYACIWDAGGSDEIRYRGALDAVIDLTAATLDYSATGGGVVSYLDGVFGGYTIAGGVVIERARSGGGDDLLTGNGADNNLRAGDGADLLSGGAGKDKLLGEAGNDTLRGGAGADKLYGGDNRDTFVFDGLDNKIDKIFDLQGVDVIDLSLIDANTGAGGDQAFVLVDAFSDTAGEARLVFNAGTNVTKLQLDVNGDGAADFVIDLAGDKTAFDSFVL